MVDKQGTGQRKRSKPLRYFYLSGELYKKLHINRPADIIIAWNYTQGKRVGLSYSFVRRRAERAYTTREVAKMLNRTRLSLEKAMLEGHVEKPQMSYNPVTGDTKGYGYKWGEKHIMDAQEHFANRHYGRPRTDGYITPKPLPSQKELRAMLREDEIFYTKTTDGRYVPTWIAEEI